MCAHVKVIKRVVELENKSLLQKFEFGNYCSFSKDVLDEYSLEEVRDLPWKHLFQQFCGSYFRETAYRSKWPRVHPKLARPIRFFSFCFLNFSPPPPPPPPRFVPPPPLFLCGYNGCNRQFGLGSSVSGRALLGGRIHYWQGFIFDRGWALYGNRTAGKRPREGRSVYATQAKTTLTNYTHKERTFITLFAKAVIFAHSHYWLPNDRS